MILPGSYLVSLVLLALALFCLGSWASTFLAAGKKWRFELYYFDFAIGVFLASIICALTLGTLGWDGFSFLDDIRLAGRRQELLALLAGMVFNLGNMLLMAAVSVVGMAVAFPVGFGFSLVVAALWSIFLGTAGSIGFRVGGSAAILIAIVVCILAYRTFAEAKIVEAIQAGKTKSTKKVINSKGIFLGIASGLFLGSFFPLVDMGRETEIGLGPYALGFVFAFGVLFSTFAFNLFFMNLPVAGKPVDVMVYVRAKLTTHAAGLSGGALWYLGTLATFVVARTEGTPAAPAHSLAFALSQGSVVVAVLWGILYWKELSSENTKLTYHVILMLAFLVLGLGLLSAAPAFA